MDAVSTRWWSSVCPREHGGRAAIVEAKSTRFYLSKKKTFEKRRSVEETTGRRDFDGFFRKTIFYSIFLHLN
jgi:hypothetical protein